MIEALDGRFVGDLELVHHDGRDSHGGSRLHEGEDDGQRGHDIGALPGDERGRFGIDQRSMLDNPDTRLDRATYSARRMTMRRDISPSLLAFPNDRSEEHTSELQSLMRISYAVFCLKKKLTHHYVIISN